MEKNGQDSFLFERIRNCNRSMDFKNATNVAKLYSSNLDTLTRAVKEVGQSKTLHFIVNCERMLIANDAERLSNDKLNKGSSTSLENASRDLEKAFTAIDAVRDIKGYKAYDSLCSLQSRDRVNGLPRDAFHRFIDSNITRINNEIISPSTSLEYKAILLERKSNMKIAKDEYMKLQAVALDIKLPEKNKERDRER